MKGSTFWDFCAPFYDMAERVNGRAYGEMLKIVRELIPQGATALEAAAGTGAVSLTIADKASHMKSPKSYKPQLRTARLII